VEHIRIYSLALLTFLWLAHPAFAEPVALVLEKVGASIPEVEPFTEILSPMEIALPAESKLVFFHYPSCETVELRGSVVRFSEEEYEVAEGAHHVITEGPCPLKVHCSEERGCETAAIVLRGLEPNANDAEDPSGLSIQLSPHPTFLLVGTRGGDFNAIRVVKGRHVVLEATVHRQRFQWPTETAPLGENTEYELTFLPKSSVVDPVHVTLTVTVPSQDAPREKLVLLRID